MDTLTIVFSGIAVASLVANIFLLRRIRLWKSFVVDLNLQLDFMLESIRGKNE